MKNGSPSLPTPGGTKGRLFRFVALLTLAVSGMTAGQAATFNVNSTADAALGAGMCDGVGTCTLRAAIQAANAAANTADADGVVQPDVINVPAGTYALSLTGINEDLAATGDLDITESVNIVGVGTDSTIIDGGAIDRVFQVMAGATVTISQLTVQNGFVDADVNNNVSGGGAGSGGAGIYNSGILRIENCKVQGNQVTAVTNTGAGGGGIQTTGVAGTGPNTVHTVVLNSVVSNNSAPLGAGIRNFFGRMDIDLTEVDNNTASLSGGGVQNADGGMSITRSVIRNNTAHQTGGGVDNLSALDISQSAIYDNQALTLTPGASAGGAGGGLANSAGGAVNMINTTISGNLADLGGGGIYNHRDLTATNSTIYDNSVNQAGGGTEIFACGSQDNSGSGCDTGIWVDPADHSKGLLINTNLVNTIVGNSTTADNCNGDPADLVISKGHNIETANTCSLNTGTDLPNTDPLFDGILKYNGGDLASLLSLAITSGSPAHDAGDTTLCTATDERNFLRDDQCDIGAYEYGALPNTSGNVLDLALDITDKVAAPLNGSVQVTMTFSIANKGPLQATNVVLTGSIPTLAGLNIGPLDSRCSLTSTGFTCNISTINAYDSGDIFVVLIATKAMSFQIGGEVTSDEVDNYRPDNLKAVTVDIPTVASSSVAGNNFAGASGGGAMDWSSLMLLVPVLARRRAQRRNRLR